MTSQNLDLFAAFGAADAAKEQDLRGYYPMAARVLAEEVRRLRRLEERVKVLDGICTDEKCNAVDIRTLRAILGQEASK